MFANDDSVRVPDDVRQALRVLFAQAVDLGLAAVAPRLDVIEGAAPSRRPGARPAA
jgi:hypothetical protein